MKIEEKVSDIIPEFGSNGKENITVEQVMLHIAGFPAAPFNALEWDNRESLAVFLGREYVMGLGGFALLQVLLSLLELSLPNRIVIPNLFRIDLWFRNGGARQP